MPRDKRDTAVLLLAPMKRMVTAGGALAAVSVLGFASPAVADVVGDDDAREEITFTYEGTPYVCTLRGTSFYQWYEETNDSLLTGTTQWTGDSCADVVLSVSMGLSYRVNDEQEGATSSARGDEVVVNAFEHGAVTAVTGSHDVMYRCDAPDAQNICSASLQTKPK